MESERTPVRDNHAPVAQESTLFSLPVSGRIPAALEGCFVQIGPNDCWTRPTGARPWFAGEGMAHALALSEGSAIWYRCRYVVSPEIAAARGIEPPYPLQAGPTGPGNAGLLACGDQLLATGPLTCPYALDTTLETVGCADFGTLSGAASVVGGQRPPGSEQLELLVQDLEPPFLRRVVLDGDGAARESIAIPLRSPTLVTDFAITTRHVAVPELPVVFDIEQSLEGLACAWRWAADHAARVGMVARTGNAATQWFELEPCFVFHVVNAFDDGDGMIVDVIRQPSAFTAEAGSDAPTGGTLQRWTLDPSRRRVTEECLDAGRQDFPTIDPRRRGRTYRFAWLVELDDAEGGGREFLVKHDLARAETSRHALGAGRQADRIAFVPAHARADEDEGFVLGFVYDSTRGASDLLVLDARRMHAPPLAVVELPCRVPFGREAKWLPQNAAQDTPAPT